MYLFYDFETSSRDLLGQILSYAFFCLDTSYTCLDTCTGYIQLNRIQLPDPDAIWVNQIHIEELAHKGIPEYEAAKTIFDFLNRCIQQYGTCTLVGFNSNRFDLEFLRSLLIRYGYNPYFMGKLQNRDVLHVAKWLALIHSESFPWELGVNALGNPYYVFKLETLAKSMGVLTAPQTHSAEEDVHLMVDLIRAFEQKFGVSFSKFIPIQYPKKPFFMLKQWEIGYSQSEAVPDHKTPRYWAKLWEDKQALLLLDLDKWQHLPEEATEIDCLSCLHRINPNKHFFISEALSAEETSYWTPVYEKASGHGFIATLTPELYYEKIKKDWDIDYQLYELGFERIPILGHCVQTLIQQPDSYARTIRTLLDQYKQNGRHKKDFYLMQLFNRAYLNWHPHPTQEHLSRYMIPRYETGTLLKNAGDFVSIDERITRIQELLSIHKEPQHQELLGALLKRYQAFFQGDC